MTRRGFETTRPRPRWTAAGCLAIALLAACRDAPAGEEIGPRVGAAAPAASRPAPPAGAESADGPPGRPAAARPELGPGFVVWESNRGGAWRIWARDLSGGAPRRLTPDEPGRDHCCPHISPDGARVAYLSSPAAGREYPADGSLGELRLIAADGTAGRVVAAAARSYFENRAAVWRSPRELIHIDGDRATVLLDLASGDRRRLADPPAERAWLIDPTLSWATTGRPEFAPYDAARRRVSPRRRLGGCQPYFSHDGRWGFWVAGAGGPIERLDPAGGEPVRILDKNDPRVPDGYGYAYFPMSSADGRLFAWAASRGGHDHFESDYEVFVAESDPDTLALLGPPLRITRHQASDRFPDVWQPPLELGRHAGEAPLTVRLSGGSAESWEWALGDGGSATGGSVEHVFEQPGRYEVVARRGDRALRGLVVARPAAPPRPIEAVARAGGREVMVLFDEPVEVADARLELAGGAAVVAVRPGDDGRSLVAELAEPLRRAAELELSGVRDRAERANSMAPARLTVEPPAWPVSRDGLVFVWETADAANLVADPELGGERAYGLVPSGRARLDAHFAMLPAGGAFTLGPDEAAAARAAVVGRNEITLEATIDSAGGDGRIVTWAGEKAINMWLEELGGGLRVGLRTGARGAGAYPKIELFDLPAGETVHLVVGYSPGRLVAYRDGRLVVDTDEPQGGFYHWRDLPLTFGGGGWRGRVEGVAIYDRVLSAAEAAEAHRLARARLAAREPLPRSVVEARLVRRSTAPTLAEITPYREALFTVEYAVERLLSGPPVGDRARVAEWVILDGETLPAARAEPGATFRLTLEPFARQPQLESVFLADTLEAGGELLYAVAAVPAR